MSLRHRPNLRSWTKRFSNGEDRYYDSPHVPCCGPLKPPPPPTSHAQRCNPNFTTPLLLAKPTPRTPTSCRHQPPPPTRTPPTGQSYHQSTCCSNTPTSLNHPWTGPTMGPHYRQNLCVLRTCHMQAPYYHHQRATQHNELLPNTSTSSRPTTPSCHHYGW